MLRSGLFITGECRGGLGLDQAVRVEGTNTTFGDGIEIALAQHAADIGRVEPDRMVCLIIDLYGEHGSIGFTIGNHMELVAAEFLGGNFQSIHTGPIGNNFLCCNHRTFSWLNWLNWLKTR